MIDAERERNRTADQPPSQLKDSDVSPPARDASLHRMTLPRSMVCSNTLVAESRLRFLLDRLRYHDPDNRGCCVAVEILASETGISALMVRRTLQALIELELVEVHHTKAGRLIRNRYRIRWDKVDERSARAEGLSRRLAAGDGFEGPVAL